MAELINLATAFFPFSHFFLFGHSSREYSEKFQCYCSVWIWTVLMRLVANSSRWGGVGGGIRDLGVLQLTAPDGFAANMLCE